ncbi:putative serine/threonine-protein kinase PBL19 [Iris pallida]|uniref:non-specific serine/threonine protein kinase n=1 Tax=Iris pallida TaxID=29817 RepID=A0AAX6GQ47_IRIPA|nr:putative serine/threonine-protein kinase PBL19 [Iris pallida]
MKCFHFSGDDADAAAGPRAPSRASWARSLSVASSGSDATARRSGSDPDHPPPPPPGRDPSPAPRRLRAFGFAELKCATRGFSRGLVIGEGGFGCVYRGVVDDGDDGAVDVAVKQLNRNGSQGHKEWITEVNFLGVVKHPNLVRLVGYCAEDDERGMQRLLVYELMPNKSLEDHLLGRVVPSLSWALRLKIAQDAARGLAYLHEEMDFQLIFRDFKTSNILLDEDFNAKLSDFGLARHGPTEGADHVLTSVVGTVGYAAPEYLQTGRLTAKSDVWSFGVVLYEIISGRRPLDRNLPRSEQKLLDWVKPYASDPKKFHTILDPRLEGQYSTRSARKLIALANKCLMKNPKSRPRMSEVVAMLTEIIEMSGVTAADTVGIIPVVEEESTDDATEKIEVPKGSGSYRNMVFDIKELMSLRNRTSGRFDWRVFTPGPGKLTRTWG